MDPSVSQNSLFSLDPLLPTILLFLPHCHSQGSVSFFRPFVHLLHLSRLQPEDHKACAGPVQVTHPSSLLLSRFVLHVCRIFPHVHFIISVKVSCHNLVFHDHFPPFLTLIVKQVIFATVASRLLYVNVKVNVCFKTQTGISRREDFIVRCIYS